MEKKPYRKTQLPRDKAREKSAKIHKPFLDSIDETPEFHDPYSELNLFLSQKIKEEIRHCSSSKKWSIHLQDELLSKITPEFQKLFPKYRLGISALKRTWEKVSFFSKQLEEQKEALTQEGKINLPFFIKENLKSAGKLKNTCALHPYHYAHQVAMKMSELFAALEGSRPKIGQLTHTIWSIQRHLIPKLTLDQFKNPYEENEKTDKLIVRSLLEIIAEYPFISQAQLNLHVKHKLSLLCLVTKTFTDVSLKEAISLLLLEKCFHFKEASFSSSEKLDCFSLKLHELPYLVAKCIQNEIALNLIDNPSLNKEELIEHVFVFFKKARAFLELKTEEQLEQKIQNWTIQAEMLLRFVRLPRNSSLLQEIESFLTYSQASSLKEFCENSDKWKTTIKANFLRKHPHLSPFSAEIEIRLCTFFKHLWYTRAFEEEVSTFDHFLKWHFCHLRLQSEEKRRAYPFPLSNEVLLQKLEELCHKMLPLIPFDRAHAKDLLLPKEEKNTQENQRDT